MERTLGLVDVWLNSDLQEQSATAPRFHAKDFPVAFDVLRGPLWPFVDKEVFNVAFRMNSWIDRFRY